MARQVDNIKKDGNAQGFDMTTGLRKSFAHSSLAEGVHVSGSASGATASGSPGAVLGTGSNTDRYTPGIEAV